MSEPNPRDDQWKEMLRAVLGDQAAEEVIASMEAQGFDPAALSRMNPSGPDFHQERRGNSTLRTANRYLLAASCTNFSNAPSVDQFRSPGLDEGSCIMPLMATVGVPFIPSTLACSVALRTHDE